MFRLTDTIEGRTRISTPTAERALRTYTSMSEADLAPRVFNLKGQELTLSELQRLAREEALPSTSETVV